MDEYTSKVNRSVKAKVAVEVKTKKLFYKYKATSISFSLSEVTAADHILIWCIGFTLNDLPDTTIPIYLDLE